MGTACSHAARALQVTIVGTLLWKRVSQESIECGIYDGSGSINCNFFVDGDPSEVRLH